ncbi:MAG: 5'-nucleotidase C-terminal domain-containing protein [Balneolaceae bacterium]|nr:5'-nucleotidase C-terminal domain-containing protein [Balneolaceae bacterium]
MRIIPALLLSLSLAGCALYSTATVEEEPELEYPNPDSEISHMLDGYRADLYREMGRPVAVVKDTLRFNQPESTLGNIVADALRIRGANELGRQVHIGVIGDSSFRLFFEPGTITVGDIYEFMPYENNLVILTLTGQKVIELVQQNASLGGAPISGVRYTITPEGNAKGILVNAEVIDPERHYRVATTSWAANGGDAFPALWEAVDRQDLDLSVRHIYIDYFGYLSEIYDIRDGRIRR